MVGCKNEQCVFIPRHFPGGLKKPAKGIIGVLDGTVNGHRPAFELSFIFRRERIGMVRRNGKKGRVEGGRKVLIFLAKKSMNFSSQDPPISSKLSSLV